MTYPAPRVERFQYPLDNGDYGFPRGQKRRITPWVLACVHISGNKNTAAMPEGIDPGSGTWAEVQYMARPGGNSAHSYVGRNGDMLDCIPWRQYAAWSNGDVKKPNTSLESVKRILATERAKGLGFNANEAFWWEVEGTGYPGKYALTPEQRETIAWRIANVSIGTGLPINRNTVLLHADIDGVDRLNCPFSAGSREKQVKALIARAQAIRKELTTKENPIVSTIGYGPDEYATLKPNAALFEVIGDESFARASEPLTRPTFGTSKDRKWRLVTADSPGDPDSAADRTAWVSSANVTSVKVIPPAAPDLDLAVRNARKGMKDQIVTAIEGVPV